MDFAILTALDIERRTVCTAFGLTSNDRVKKDDCWYWCGKLPLHDGSAYDIVVAQPVDTGQVEAAVLVTDVLRHWQPRATLLVGIAASTDPYKVKLGDVVVGQSVYYYERGRVTENGIKPEPEMLPADSALLKHYTGLADWNGAVLAQRPDGTSGVPRVFKGVIASGDKVVAHEAARDAIAAGHRKILALEMEAYGFSRAALNSSNRIRHLVIRGISDEGDAHKNDDWHEYAAAAAAGFARHFLLDRPIEPIAHPSPADGESRLRSMQQQGRLPKLVLSWRTKSGGDIPGRVKFGMEIRNVGSCAVYELCYFRSGIDTPSPLQQLLLPQQVATFTLNGDVNKTHGQLLEALRFRYSTEFGEELDDIWEFRFDLASADRVSLKHLEKKWVGKAGLLTS